MISRLGVNLAITLLLLPLSEYAWWTSPQLRKMHHQGHGGPECKRQSCASSGSSCRRCEFIDWQNWVLPSADCCCKPAGTIPPLWFAGNSSLRVNLLRLSLAANLLHGSIPLGANNAGGHRALDLIIDPMGGQGLCGTVPSNVNATSLDGSAPTDASGLLAGGSCPTPGGQIDSSSSSMAPSQAFLKFTGKCMHA